MSDGVPRPDPTDPIPAEQPVGSADSAENDSRTASARLAGAGAALAAATMLSFLGAAFLLNYHPPGSPAAGSILALLGMLLALPSPVLGAASVAVLVAAYVKSGSAGKETLAHLGVALLLLTVVLTPVAAYAGSMPGRAAQGDSSTASWAAPRGLKPLAVEHAGKTANPTSLEEATAEYETARLLLADATGVPRSRWKRTEGGGVGSCYPGVDGYEGPKGYSWVMLGGLETKPLEPAALARLLDRGVPSLGEEWGSPSVEKWLQDQNALRAMMGKGPVTADEAMTRLPIWLEWVRDDGAVLRLEADEDRTTIVVDSSCHPG